MKQTVIFLTLLTAVFSTAIGQTYYQLPDMAPGSISAQHYGVVGEVGGKMLFRVRIGSSSDYQLWEVDGTTAQAKKLMDGYVELYWSPPILADGKLYFVAQPEEFGGPAGSIYSYDGQTVELVVSQEPLKMAWFQDKLFFLKHTVLFDSVALYQATANPDAPQKIKGFNFVNMMDIVAYNGELIIMAGQNGDTYLFHSDGTTAGTMPIVQLGEDSNTSTPVYFTEKNGKLYFQYRSNAASPPPIGLYKTDGTAAGTVRLRDLYTRSGSVTPTDGFEPQYIWSNDTMYTAGNSPDYPNVELWLLDAANDSADFVVDVNGNTSTHSLPRRFVELNGVVYFTATLSNNRPAIFRTDGTAAGTYQVLANVFAGPSARYGDWLTVYDGKLAFRGRTQSDGGISQLWFSDGTDAGTYKATNIVTGSDYGPTNLYAMGGLLFYSANAPGHGAELWVYNNGSVPTIQGSPSNIGCNDNGTTSNPTDDYISFEFNPTQIALSDNYTVSIDNGAVSPPGGSFGQSTSFQLPAGSAGNGDLTVTVADAVDTAFSVQYVLPDPGTCSPIPLMEASLSNILCNDNGTASEASDDYISFELLASGYNLGSGFGVSASAGTVQPSIGTYGSSTMFTLPPGSAVGGDVVLTLTDELNQGYQIDVVVANPGTCSNAPLLMASIGVVGCVDNLTPLDPADDYIVFDLTATGLNLGSSFLLSSTVGIPEPSLGVYGVSSSYQLPIGSAGEGDVLLTISDVETGFSTEATILDPGTCSTTLATEGEATSVEVLTVPNPFDGAVSFKMANYQGHSKLELQIFSPLGKQLKVLPFEHNDTLVWNPGTLPSGVYYVFVRNMLTDALVYKGLAFKK